MPNGKFATTLRNIIEIGIFFLLADLIYTISMLGIKFTEMSENMRIATEILKLLTKRMGVDI